MNAIMNEKGRQTKLLAAIAIIAMVVCVFAIALPASEVDSVATPDEALVYDEETGFATAGGVYKLTSDWELSGDSTIPANVALYTNGNEIDASSHKLTIDGVLYVNGDVNNTTSTLIIGGMTDDNLLANNKIVFDNNGSLYLNTTPILGVGSDITLNAGGTLEVTENDGVDGFTVTLATGSATVEDYSVYQTDNIVVASGTTLTVTGDLENDGSITNNGTIAINENATVTNKSNGTVTNNSTGTVTNNGTITNDGGSFSNAGTITNNSTVTLTSGTFTNDGTFTNNGTIDGDNSLIVDNGNLKAVYSGGKFYGTIEDALKNTTTSQTILIYGDYSRGGNITLDDSTMIKNVMLAEGASYSGTIKYVAEYQMKASADAVDASSLTETIEVTINATEVKNVTTLVSAVAPVVAGNQLTVATPGTLTVAGNPQMTSESDGYMVGSDVIITNITDSNVVAGSSTAMNNSAVGVVLKNVAIASMTLNVPVTVDGKVVIPQNEELSFGNAAGVITVGADDQLYVLGILKSSTPSNRIVNGANDNVFAMDTASVNYFLSGNDAVALSETEYNLTYDGTEDGAKSIINTLKAAVAGTKFNLSFTGTGSASNVLIITGEVALDGITISIDEEKPVNIQIGIPADGQTAATPASVSLNNVTIDSTGCSMVVSAGSTLDIVDSLLFIAVTGDSDSITVDNEDVEYTNTTDQVKVGFGTTLNLTGNVRSIAAVYGDLVISNTASVPAGTEMVVYAGGSVTVDGTLTILGTATFDPESEVIVNGTVVVGNNTGGAILDVDGSLTVSESGTLTVTGIAADLPNKNKLQAPEDTAYNATTKTYTDALTVLGTLNMNGELSGKIIDKGTVVLNGFAVSNPTIYIYDGISLEVTSIANSLTISDAYAAYEKVNAGNANMAYADGNSVTINNVRGFTVADTVVDVPYTDSKGTSHIDYYAYMTIGGQVSAITGTTGSITVVDAGDKTVGEKDEYYAYTTVAADTTMQFGANVNFTVNGDLIVAGDIEYLDAGTSSSPDNKEMAGNGTITVTGEIAVSEGYYGFSGIMNAAQYRVTVTGTNASVTDYYTGFAAAIAAAPDADNDTVNIYGTVEVPADVTIAAGIDVVLQQNATVKIGSDAEVILSAGAEMRGPSTSSIVVEGIFTAQNYNNDLDVNNIDADVVIVDEPAKTWTSLANAIAMGETEITLNQDIVIDEDTTIPAGVTVNSQYDVTIDDATLTVNGALNIDRADLTLVEDTDAELVVGGVTSIRMLLAGNGSYNGFDGIAGAHYGLTQGAYITYYVSNMDIATQNVNGKANVYNDTVTVVGSVSAGEITFQGAENHNLTITLAQGTADEPTFLSVGTMSFEGNVKLVVPASNALFTGTVSAPVADGAADTVLQMSRVGGITVDTYSVLGASTEYVVSAYGAYSGAVTVNSGALTVGKTGSTAGTNTLSVGTEGTLDVASGASMEVPSGMVFDVDKADTVEIAGTITVENASGITGVDMLVSGTMNVEANLNTTTTLYVTGALNVASDYTMVVSGKLVVGAAPESLGVGGSLAGDFTITSNTTSYILAYAGADLTQATIQWNDALNQSNAETTTYVINGVEYATVYATGAVPINGVFGTADSQEEIVLSGLITDYHWFETAETAEAYSTYTGNNNNPYLNQAVTGNIGAEETVYAYYNPSVIAGTVTNGAGIDIFIDGALFYNTNTDGSANASLTVGTHKISYEIRAGWDGSNVVLTYNGQTIQNGDTITVTADMTSFTLSATGAINSTGTSDSGSTTGGDDGLGLTDYLLIVLVVLIVVMAIIVAIRLMRS